MTGLHIIAAIIGLSIKAETLLAMYCQEEMMYHERYGYGYDISCSRLNSSTVAELRTVTVYNEMRLTVLRSNLTDLSPSLFGNLPRLRQLVISQSRLNLSSNVTYFEALEKLELLSLTSNNIKAIPEATTRGLSNLRTLNVSDNQLTFFGEGTLSNLQNLEELDLSRNKLNDVAKIGLCEAQQLRRLYLQNNYLSSLKNTSMQCLKLLKVLMADFNRIEELTSLSRLRYLTHISFNYNKIRDITESFRRLENLETISLEGNKLEKINSSYFAKAVLLQRLNLASNRISFISAGAFANLTFLAELNLQNNSLNKIPVLETRSLRRFYLSFNNLSAVNQELSNLASLESLDLSHCSIRTLSKQCFHYLNLLQMLDLSYNNITLTSSSFYGLHSLTQLSLRGNLLLGLPDYAFQFVANLEILDLSNNKLKRLGNLTFHNLKHLESLNLSYNLLETLSETVVLPLRSLKKLDLEGNRLKSIDYDIIISLLTNLKLINIRENRLPCEFLAEMLHYFKTKRIGYTINEKMAYDKENVAGIHCQEYDKLNGSLRRADALLANDSALLNEIYHIAKKGNASLGTSQSTTSLIFGLVFLMLLLTVAGISYRVYVIVKRRGHVSDEIELLDSRLHKWNVL